MSLWTRITDALSALAKGEGLGAVFDRLRSPPERSVAFTIAVIALSAKMAKADGRVTRDEVTAFREVFQVPTEEEAAASRVFNLAREDVAGFEEYAARIARMFADNPAVLSDLMEGLFHIACADGAYHPKEDMFLERVAEIFGMSPRDFTSLRARHVPDAAPDPYAVLGVDSTMSLEEIRAVWRSQVRETHPDRMMGRGVPEEAIRLAEMRLRSINRAWEEISAHRRD
ncbi:molecular chaperone DjiA [Rhodophyticola porphyridii]|uniref:Molecular chaperone DjiA n=1 Tax=Rhodophyticola porphyridii TaxID=1852017 RepID=A0A3L9Y5L4_9RHOB|nr:molecular chaperone DjiA [Rhodophyticola porphyridii]RMA41623.1 molecular chaperone DjiA [Rhodophyticola porphyridii]